MFEVLEDVKFRDWHFAVIQRGAHSYLQIKFLAPDSGISHIEDATQAVDIWQHGRKWLLSRHMTDGEVVQTAFKAIMAALEHEAREEFKYKDMAIFGPHYDIEALVDLCRQGKVVEREPHWTQSMQRGDAD